MKKAELVKIRIEGSAETLATVSAVLKQVLPVIEVSKDYPKGHHQKVCGGMSRCSSRPKERKL